MKEGVRVTYFSASVAEDSFETDLTRGLIGVVDVIVGIDFDGGCGEFNGFFIFFLDKCLISKARYIDRKSELKRSKVK